jgi:geranylgeranyl pyrophosphate synthase
VKLPETGAAVELGYLAFLAHSGVEDGATGWGNTFSILVGEFLLAKAYELAGQVSVQTSVDFSQSVTVAIRGQLRSRQSARNTACGDRDVLDRLSLTAGTMASLPCRLGARVAGASAEVVNALDRFGACLGVAHALIDEVQMMEGTDDPLAEVAAFDPDDGIYGLSILHALRAGTADSARLAALLGQRPVDRVRVGALVRRSGVLDGIRTLAGEYAGEAVSALETVPRHAARVALKRIADYAVHRTQQEVGTSSELLDALSEV